MSEYIDKSEAVGEGYLADWYIHSVAEYDDEKLNEPRWTEKHIEELVRDFIVIPKDTSAADVAPVVRGSWDGTADGYADGELVYDMWSCSVCGFDADGADEKPAWKYCPNCGAKMDA